MAIDDSHATGVNIFFGTWAGMNVVAKVPTEGAVLGSCVEEVYLGGGGCERQCLGRGMEGHGGLKLLWWKWQHSGRGGLVGHRS